MKGLQKGCISSNVALKTRIADRHLWHYTSWWSCKEPSICMNQGVLLPVYMLQKRHQHSLRTKTLRWPPKAISIWHDACPGLGHPRYPDLLDTVMLVMPCQPSERLPFLWRMQRIPFHPAPLPPQLLLMRAEELSFVADNFRDEEHEELVLVKCSQCTVCR